MKSTVFCFYLDPVSYFYHEISTSHSSICIVKVIDTDFLNPFLW